MPQAAEPVKLAEAEPPAPELRLLIASEPWPRNFLRNLGDLFRRPEPGPQLESAPAAFWPDVFVSRKLPWHRFLQSTVFHILALIAIWEGTQFLALHPGATVRRTERAEVVSYTPSEYLPPLDTRRADPAPARKADPEYSAQPIISLPPEPDNRSQTIVTAPDIHLDHDVPLPNMVAMSDNPRMPIGPAPEVPASQLSRLAPRMERSVIAPPPDLQASSEKSLQAPLTAVIAPPPSVEASSARRLGDLNIGHSAVIAPAPQLALNEQRAVTGRTAAALRSGQSPAVVAPPPSLAGTGRSRSGGTMVALSLHPAVGAPPTPPAGNRRGSFASTPEGHHGASGAAGASGTAKGNGSGSTGKNGGDLPSGLYVGKTANATSAVAGDPAPKSLSASVNPNLMAGARPPRTPARSLQPASDSKISEEEREVFGARKFYSLSLNMPNLNSAGGSWIIRFAALKPDSGSANPASAADPPADLTAPSATRKVDPAYPLELMRQNVGGTVILYAVIHADGTVGNVRVLRSVDERLDHFASEAIVKSHFEPATKEGTAVDVEATFSIPFRPARTTSSF